MERVTFLVEQTNERIACLLNPESLEIKRIAGVKKRSLSERPLSGTMQSDTPLQFTGGGETEFQFDLLFDVSVAGSTIQTTNVRKLTAPLWDLSENKYNSSGSAYLPVVRFIWGKSWNVPGIVTSVAERLEAFSPGGEPGRSWLRMRMLRVSEQQASEESQRPVSSFMNHDGQNAGLTSGSEFDPAGLFTTTQQPGFTQGVENRAENVYGNRLDLEAYAKYGDPSKFREILDERLANK